MEKSVFDFLYNLAHRSNFLDGVFIFLGSYFSYFINAAWLLFLFYYRRPWWHQKFSMFIVGGLAVIISRGILAEVVKFFYDRKMPFKVLEFDPLINVSENYLAFGYAAFFFALAFSVFYFDKNWGYWFFAAVLINQLARVTLGVHWPTDILIGFFLALISFIAVKFLVRPRRDGEVSNQQSK